MNKICRNVIFVVFFLFQVASVYTAELTFVSLGPNCQPAWRIDRSQLRTEAYPFDWVLAQDINVATKAIEENFAHWVDPQYLVYDKSGILNSYYNIKFKHDFPFEKIYSVDRGDYCGEEVKSNYLDYLPEVKQKYERRINRLYKLLQSSERVIFVCTFTSDAMAQQFVRVIKKKFPQLDFLLAVVNPASPIDLPFVRDNYTYNECAKNANTENIRFFYPSQLEDGIHQSLGWWTEEEWDHIFKQIQTLQTQLSLGSYWLW